MMAKDTEADQNNDNSLYPTLPPSPLRRLSLTSRYIVDDPLAPLRMTRFTPSKNTSPANIGRPRRSSRIAALTSSPVRSSYATQMSHHFTRSHTPSPAPADVVRPQLRHDERHACQEGSTERYHDLLPTPLAALTCSSKYSSVNSDEDPLADLEMLAESPLESAQSPCQGSQPGSPLPWSRASGHREAMVLDGTIIPGRNHSITSPPVSTSSIGLARFSGENTASSGSAWFCAAASPKKLPHRVDSAMPSPNRSQACEDVSSSESWSGDDDFVPRSARRRARQQRLEQRQAQVAFEVARKRKPGTASGFEGPTSPAFQKRLKVLNTKNPSRFRNRLHTAKDSSVAVDKPGFEAVAGVEKENEVTSAESPTGCDADHEGEGGDVRMK